MTNQQFQILTEKYLAGKASAEEKQLIDAYLDRLGREEPGIITRNEIEASTASILAKVHADMHREQVPLHETGSELEPMAPPRSISRRALRYAAAVLIIAGAATLYLRVTTRQQPAPVVRSTPAPPVNDALPGSNKAILVLANGSQVVLEDDASQTIKEQDGQQIANNNGSLSYITSATINSANTSSATANPATNTIATNTTTPPTSKDATDPAATKTDAPLVFYNTVRVPRKGQYRLILADGTKVWLNAESSLRYPTAFSGAERRVEVTGEAYFEVANNAKKPFHVIHNNMDIQVLGTRFNVNSYDDEHQGRVTLLEGAVNVSSPLSNTTVRLDPGQQARCRTDGKLAVIDNVDTEEVIAWKEGRFQFKAATLESIMRQLTRWYDIEVEYRGDFSHRHFTADISRNKNLSSVIKILELNNITCTIEDHKLIVTP